MIAGHCAKNNINITVYGDEAYPPGLMNIFSPPPVLYYRGTLPYFASDPIFTIVGTRKSTKDGERAAYEFASALSARGMVIVSGMAYGNDTQANLGALKGGGRTVAVLGCGVDVVYPPTNKVLMNDIIANGAVISEFPPGTFPYPQNFPQRNRIMAGISMGTLVVEAPEKSGACITANLAMEQGKDVFVIPGSIYSPTYQGCIRLMQDGVQCAFSPDDIINFYKNMLVEAGQPAAEDDDPSLKYIDLPPVEGKIIELLLHQKKLYIDDITAALGYSAPQILTSVMSLELKGHITNLGGDVYCCN